MKRFMFLLLVPIFTATAVASAESVSAPNVPRETLEVMPVKATLELYVPPIIDPVEEARLAARAQVTTQAVADGNCPQWAGLAFDIGWPVDQIPELLRIMNRESRCLPEACSESDSGRVCRDWGLMQINEYSWRSTIRKQGMEMADMWNPELNLRFALWLYQYSEERNGDGWQPWDMSHAS